MQWSGQFQYLKQAEERLKFVVPLTLAIISVLLYMNTRSVAKTFIVLLAVPFSLYWRVLVARAARLSHERFRLSRFDFACGHGRRDRSRDTALTRSPVRRA